MWKDLLCRGKSTQKNTQCTQEPVLKRSRTNLVEKVMSELSFKI